MFSKASLELRRADGSPSKRRNGENGEFRESVPPEVRRQGLRNASEREEIITDTLEMCPVSKQKESKLPEEWVGRARLRVRKEDRRGRCKQGCSNIVCQLQAVGSVPAAQNLVCVLL